MQKDRPEGNRSDSRSSQTQRDRKPQTPDGERGEDNPRHAQRDPAREGDVMNPDNRKEPQDKPDLRKDEQRRDGGKGGQQGNRNVGSSRSDSR